MITIDGSRGEGGGQILRSALSLSLITNRPVTLERIRAKRSKPGLQRQHLTCVLAAQEVGQAEVVGAEVGSPKLVFHPRAVRPGEYRFAIGTAGSTTLVLQTVLPALMLCDTPSTVELEGGTHNRAAPPADFLARSYLPQVARMGPQVELHLDRHGFHPAGQGRLRAIIHPHSALEGLTLTEPGRLRETTVEAIVAHLPKHIGDRECETIRRLAGWPKATYRVTPVEDSVGPGNVVLIDFRFDHVTAVFTGFGERGLPAEKVARRTYRAAADFLKAKVPVDEHLCDQLLLPIGIAATRGQASRLRTVPLSLHSLTQIELLEELLEVSIEANPHEDVIEITTLAR